MAEIVAVFVGLAAPVVVAVHVNGTATVGVIGPKNFPETSWPGLYRRCRDFATVPDALYSRGIELLERVVAMLTKLIHP